MDQFIGADVEGLRRLATRFDRSAGDLRTTAKRLERPMADPQQWLGRDADTARAEWRSTSVPSLQRVADLLERRSRDIRRHVDEQEQASNDTGPAIGGGGGGGGISPGGGPGAWSGSLEHRFLDVDGNASTEWLVNADGVRVAAGLSGAAYLAQLKASGRFENDYVKAQADAWAQAAARANAEASVTAGRNGLQANAGLDGYVGLEAGGEARLDIGGFEPGVRGRAYFGLGGNIEGEAKFGWDEIRITGEAGFAIGPGFSFGPDIQVNPRRVAQNVSDFWSRNNPFD